MDRSISSSDCSNSCKTRNRAFQSPTTSTQSTPISAESASIQQVVCVRAICKHCKQSFNLNNKLHEHIREHHARKPIKNSLFQATASRSTYNIDEKPSVACPPAPLAPSSSSATPRSKRSSTKIASQFLLPKCSKLPIATYKFSPRSMKNVWAHCPPTPSPSSRMPTPKHQESHIQKSYLTMDDLRRMFAGKPRPFDLRQNRYRRFIQTVSHLLRQKRDFASVKSFSL